MFIDVNGKINAISAFNATPTTSTQKTPPTGKEIIKLKKFKNEEGGKKKK